MQGICAQRGNVKWISIPASNLEEEEKIEVLFTLFPTAFAANAFSLDILL